MPDKFNLGELLITFNAVKTLHPEDVVPAVDRHASCDWGELCDEDKQLNDQGLIQGTRLFSSYIDRNGIKFWIITAADCSITTVLLPDDY